MKQLIIILVILVSGLIGLGIYGYDMNKSYSTTDGRIKAALIEYYEPDRRLVLPYTGISDIVQKNYQYKSHKILKIVHYGEKSTVYTIEHRYTVNDSEIERTDTIKVRQYADLLWSVEDGLIWKIE